MSESGPLVSVIMPVYNCEKYVGEAIESILNQTFKDFEFIILDDASTDGTWKIIQEYAKKDNRIRVFQNEINLKLAKTLNLGISHAKGKYIARMDADDISFPNRLEVQTAFMENSLKVGILGGSMEIMNQSGDKISNRNYHKEDSKIRRHLFRYSPFCHPAVMIRKEIFDKTQGYRHEYNPAEDYELYFQLGRYCEFANLGEDLLRYRVAENSMTLGRLRKMETKTIKTRFKYFLEYKGNLLDLIYSVFQLFTLYFVPASVRIYLFMKVREQVL